jgi:hypothetical protein
LLVLARKPPTGMIEIMSSSTDALKFFRDAKSMNLDEKEWRKLGEHLKKLRG